MGDAMTRRRRRFVFNEREQSRWSNRDEEPVCWRCVELQERGMEPEHDIQIHVGDTVVSRQSRSTRSVRDNHVSNSQTVHRLYHEECYDAMFL